MKLSKSFVLALAALMGVGCAGGKDFTAPIEPPTPPIHTPHLSITVTAGDSQTAEVTHPLPMPIVVTVVDTTPAGSNQPIPVEGQLVNFVVTSGGGSVFAGSALTDKLGQAQEFFTLGTEAGEQCLEVRAVVDGQRVTFSKVCATATPGAPGLIRLIGGPFVPDSFATTDTIDMLNQTYFALDIYDNLIGYGLLIPDSLIREVDRTTGSIVRIPADLPFITRLSRSCNGMNLCEIWGYSRYMPLATVPADTWRLEVFVESAAYPQSYKMIYIQ